MADSDQDQVVANIVRGLLTGPGKDALLLQQTRLFAAVRLATGTPPPAPGADDDMLSPRLAAGGEIVDIGRESGSTTSLHAPIAGTVPSIMIRCCDCSKLDIVSIQTWFLCIRLRLSWIQE